MRIAAICAAMVVMGTHGASLAQAPCSLQPLACTRVFTETDVRVSLTTARPGDSGGTVAIGGKFGENTNTSTRNGVMYRTQIGAKGSESIGTISYASTGDNLVFAHAQTSADLKSGTLRAKIDGLEALLPPQSIFEDSFASTSAFLQETIHLKLPKNFSGGVAKIMYTVEGTLGDTRSFNGSSTNASAQIGTQFGQTLGSWIAPGHFIELLSTQVTLPALPGFDFPIRLIAGLRLSSGQGAGAYDVNLFNTATVSLLVPDGVVWTSDSGLFLSAVPEPSNAAMLLAGILALALIAHAKPSMAKK